MERKLERERERDDEECSQAFHTQLQVSVVKTTSVLFLSRHPRITAEPPGNQYTETQ